MTYANPPCWIRGLRPISQPEVGIALKNINGILKTSIEDGTGWKISRISPVWIRALRYQGWLRRTFGSGTLSQSFKRCFSGVGRLARIGCIGCIFGVNPINSAQAGVYRCKDAAGKIAYSQLPCPAEQQSDQLRGINATVRQDKDICRDARDLGMRAFTQLRSGSEPDEIIDEFGGLNYINPPTLGVINFAASLRYNTDVTPQRVGSMTFGRCLEGGFGKLSPGDLPNLDAQGKGRPGLTDPEPPSDPHPSP